MLREIPREYWPEFVSCFANEHRGLPVTLERRSRIGSIIEAQGWSLQQVVTEAAADHRQISIILGEENGARLTHVVDDPASVRVIGDEDEERVELEAADGTVSVIHLASKPQRQPRAAAVA